MVTKKYNVFWLLGVVLFALMGLGLYKLKPARPRGGDILVIWPLDEKEKVYQKWNGQLEDSLLANNLDVNVHYLYLSWDMGHKELRRFEMLRDTLRHLEARGQRPQLILTYGDMSTYAVAANPYGAFRQIPVVFFGTHFPNYEGLKERFHKNMTGLVDSVHIKQNLDLIDDVMHKRMVVTQLEWSLNWCDSLLRKSFDEQMEQLDTTEYFNMMKLDKSGRQIQANYGKKMFYALSVNSPDCNWGDNGQGFTADFSFSGRSHTVTLQTKYDYYCYSKHMDEPCSLFFTTKPQHFETNDSCAGGYFPMFRTELHEAIQYYAVPILKEGMQPWELPVRQHSMGYYISWKAFRNSHMRLSDLPDYVTVYNVTFRDRYPLLAGFLFRMLCFAIGIGIVLLHYVFYRESMRLAKQKEMRRRHNLELIERKRELEVMLSNSQTITCRSLDDSILVTHSLRPEYAGHTYRISYEEAAQCIEEFYRKKVSDIMRTDKPGNYAVQFRGMFFTEVAHWYEMRMNVRETPNGLVKSGIVVVIDAIKKEEAMLLEAHRRKLNAQERDNFINEMSHEIRTPLNAIVGFSQILTTPGMEVTDEEFEQFREIIESNNKRLLKLIEDMLTIAHLRNASVALHFREVPVPDMLDKMLDDFGNEAREKDVTLSIDKGPDGTCVWVDPTAFEVVLSNLVSNGVKFTHGGGSVTLGWNEDCEAVYVYVADTGIGIAAEHMDLIFHRFFKADPFTTGSGLGLSLVREFLGQMGGEVNIQSALGKGTRVTVTMKKKEQHGETEG
jgi:signal transduction histidine kinase